LQSLFDVTAVGAALADTVSVVAHTPTVDIETAVHLLDRSLLAVVALDTLARRTDIVADFRMENQLS